MNIYENVSVSVSSKAVFSNASREELYSLLDPILAKYLEEAENNLKAHSEYLKKYSRSGDTELMDYQRNCKVASELWVAHLKDAISSLHKAVEQGHLMYSKARGCKNHLTVGSFIDFRIMEKERIAEIRNKRRMF